MTEQAEAEIIEPGQQPKMPRGVALMVKSILGLDPAAIMKQFDEAFKLMVGFCKHADARMGAMATELRALKEEVAALRVTVQQQPPSEEKSHERN